MKVLINNEVLMQRLNRKTPKPAPRARITPEQAKKRKEKFSAYYSIQRNNQQKQQELLNKGQPRMPLNNKIFEQKRAILEKKLIDEKNLEIESGKRAGTAPEEHEKAVERIDLPEIKHNKNTVKIENYSNRPVQKNAWIRSVFGIK